MATDVIDSIPAESIYELKKNIPVEIMNDTGELSVFYAYIDPPGASPVTPIHSYGFSQSEAVTNLEANILIQMERHEGYTGAELSGRVTSKLARLNQYLRLK